MVTPTCNSAERKSNRRLVSICEGYTPYYYLKSKDDIRTADKQALSA